MPATLPGRRAIVPVVQIVHDAQCSRLRSRFCDTKPISGQAFDRVLIACDPPGPESDCVRCANCARCTMLPAPIRVLRFEANFTESLCLCFDWLRASGVDSDCAPLCKLCMGTYEANLVMAPVRRIISSWHVHVFKEHEGWGDDRCRAQSPARSSFPF